MTSTEPEVRRIPILIAEHTVALISLYRRTDKIEDSWAWDYCNAHETQESAALQFCEQLEGRWTPAFLMALRTEITRRLANHDEQFGTNFADPQ